jgi:single-stranded-DNA-specific exonuclease
VFAKLGLEALRTAVNPGLRALLEVAQIGSSRPPSSGEIAFRIAPRLNAAGRMDVARDVVELFSVKDPVRARELANRLNQLNADRQGEEKRILECIEQRLEQEPVLRDAYCMVIDGDGWHRGVIGITATRVVERYGRPTLIISREGDEAHGSGRSIPSFHLLEALESCAPLFTRYGGHAHAVGFALPASNVAELGRQLDGWARARLTESDFELTLHADAELPLDRITPQWFKVLQSLEPFGMGNPEPVFVAYGARLTAPTRVMKDKHIKLKLGATAKDGKEEKSWRNSITWDALGWRMAERLENAPLLPGDLVDVAYTLDYSDHPEYGGFSLALKDFRASTPAENPPQDATAARA